MRILGIDPGLATIGLGLIEATSPTDVHVVDWLTITTKPGLTLAERLCEIHKDLGQFLDDEKPALVIVEKIFFANNEKTAIDVAQARGAIVLSVAQRGIRMLEPTPLQMKLGVTGDGSADKIQVQTMLMHILKLTELPKPDDAADALGLAIYGALNMKTLSLAQ